MARALTLLDNVSYECFKKTPISDNDGQQTQALKPPSTDRRHPCDSAMLFNCNYHVDKSAKRRVSVQVMKGVRRPKGVDGPAFMKKKEPFMVWSINEADPSTIVLKSLETGELIQRSYRDVIAADAFMRLCDLVKSHLTDKNGNALSKLKEARAVQRILDMEEYKDIVARGVSLIEEPVRPVAKVAPTKVAKPVAAKPAPVIKKKGAQGARASAQKQARASRPKNPAFPRPRGRAPKGKVWDYGTGLFVPIEVAAVAPVGFNSPAPTSVAAPVTPPASEEDEFPPIEDVE